MDKNVFNSLSQKSKIENIINFGEIINELEEKDFYTSLFLLNDFYVELYLHKHSNEITSVEIQEHPDKLVQYIHSKMENVTILLEN